MRSLLTWLLLALASLVAGCFPPGIYSEQPLGEVAVLKPEEWNGIWVNNRGKFARLAVMDADRGALDNRPACDPLPSTKSDKFRQFGPWYIFDSPKHEQGPAKGLYEIRGLFFRDERVFIGYIVNAEHAKALVEQGAVPGRIENDRVILGTLMPEHYRVLFPEGEPKSGKEAPPVLWKPLIILLKLPDEFDPCKKGEQAK